MPEVTESAVSKARKKLNPADFIELNDALINGYEEYSNLIMKCRIQIENFSGKTVQSVYKE